MKNLTKVGEKVKLRITVCFLLAVLPASVFHLLAILYWPDLLPNVIAMRYVWGISAAVVLGALIWAKILFKDGLGGSIIMIVAGPVSILTVLFFMIWHKIRPIEGEF